ncbi:putative chromosome segregation protein [Mycobacterium phage WXIN]|nr:putative chromosome segregation protein [Mycobacterium phage WXIN]
MIHVHDYSWAEEPGTGEWFSICECGFMPSVPAWRVLITGSRRLLAGMGLESSLGLELLYADALGLPLVVIHGAAPGADTLAHEWAELIDGVTPDPHPANWRAGKQAGHVRNQVMVDHGADVCLAFPLPGSTGTWDCVRRAEAAGIPVKVFEQ